MDDEQPRSPWGSLYRADIKSGFAYPVRASHVATALRSAGAEVGSLSFIVARAEGRLGPKRPPGLLLLWVEWHERGEMPYQRGGGGLAIYAVPSARRAEVNELIVREALPAAAHWLADAAKRGEVWREMRHERWFLVRETGLYIEDREGGHWTTVQRT
jgi:hypothetical protein